MMKFSEEGHVESRKLGLLLQTVRQCVTAKKKFSKGIKCATTRWVSIFSNKVLFN
jgi:hypothetical protein